MSQNQKEDGCCTKFATTSGLCCFMSPNDYKHKPLAEVVQNDRRRCTDLPCCLILLFGIISEIYLIIYSTQNGAQPQLLMYGYDSRILNDSASKPMICNGDNSNGAYTIWPDLYHTDIRVCQSSCSSTWSDNVLISSIDAVYYPSDSFMNAYCLPDYTYKNISSLGLPSSFTNSAEAYQRAVSDLQTSAWLILIMSIAAILISYFYIKIIACVGRMLIIFTILIVLVGGTALCWLLISDGHQRMESDETEDWGKYEFWSGIILSIVMVFFILALFFMRKSIELIVKMMNEASHAIRDMKFTLIFPIFMAFIGIGYMAFWVAEALYIYSVKDATKVDYPSDSFINSASYPGEQYWEYEFDSTMQNALKWHFVMLFYISQVIIYFGFMVLAGVFSDWYFSVWEDKGAKVKKRGDGVAELSNSPICESFWRVIRYHLGSLAFGALIITIIRIIRAIVTYIQKKVMSKPGGSNPLFKCIVCCIQCCLKCCQCIFDKINKEGFIFTTIYGTPFCYSSFTALKLLVHNIGRSVMIDAVSKYTELFGRVVIALLNTGLSVVIMKYYPYYSENLSSYFLPSVVIFVISYIIAALFMMVFEVAVEAIFLCYLVDEEVHSGNAKFANHELTQMSSFIPRKGSYDDSDNTELGRGSSYDPPRQKTTDHNVDYTVV